MIEFLGIILLAFIIACAFIFLSFVFAKLLDDLFFKDME